MSEEEIAKRQLTQVLKNYLHEKLKEKPVMIDDIQHTADEKPVMIDSLRHMISDIRQINKFTIRCLDGLGLTDPLYKSNLIDRQYEKK